MTDKERKIIDKRLYGNLSKLGRKESKEASMKLDEIFCKEFTVNPFENHEYFIDLLRVVIKEKNKNDLESIISIISHFGFFEEIIDLVVPLFIEDWHQMHESLVFGISKYKNPIIIDYLYKTAEIKFEYLEYEEDYLELSRKCIWELCKINTSESIEKIHLLAKSSDPIVAKHALDRLAGKN